DAPLQLFSQQAGNGVAFESLGLQLIDVGSCDHSARRHLGGVGDTQGSAGSYHSGQQRGTQGVTELGHCLVSVFSSEEVGQAGIQLVAVVQVAKQSGVVGQRAIRSEEHTSEL